MKIRNIQINSFRSIKEPFILNNPGKLHFFIGSNDAGKTSLLDAINQLYDEKSIKLSSDNINLSIEFSIKSKSGKIFSVVQKRTNKIYKIDNKIISNEKAKKILNNHIIRLDATKPVSIKKIKEDYHNFYTKYSDIFNIFCDTISNFILYIPINNKYFTGKNKKYSFDKLSNGFQQVFITLLYLFHPQYKILLLDEPEIHLHPALIKKLLSVLEHKNLDNQVFLTTHSPLFIRTTNLHRLFRVTRGLKSTRIFSPRLAGKKINYTRLKQELNADNCEMFFADKVLLVEGPSDHILMRELINRFYSGKKEIKVIQTYGKSNIDVYSELLEIFKIPYSVLLDLDALYDTGIKLLQKRINNRITKPEQVLIKELKKSNIFILPNGSIEKNYPRRYQRRHKHKPQNALYAANRIRGNEYNSPLMRHLKEVIEKL